MKVKTSVTLSPELIEAIDRIAGKDCSRSAFIERAVRQRLRQLEREERNLRDAEIYERLASDATFESDVSDYSTDPMELGDDASLLIDPDRFREAG